MAAMTEYQTITGTEAVLRDGTIKLHGPAGIEGMRKAGRLAADILDALYDLVKPGVTTGELDDVVRQMTLDGGGVPPRSAIAAIRTAAASRSTTWSATAFRATR